ncbi:MAG: hypothetical protein ACK2UK_10400 [Candidatus Promineifilaceae bacterium]
MTLLAPRWIRALLLPAALLILPALACRMPDIPAVPSIPGVVQPTPVASPTPLGDTISYLIPAYAQRLQPGETVPGTQLTYLGDTGNGFEVSIGGQQAVKRAGDSFYWSGVIAPGVFANYNLRLTTGFFGGMPVAGPVELVILFPNPQPLPIVDEPVARMHLGNIVIDYHVPLNHQIPGTTLVYQGLESQGLGNQSTTLARIGGLSGYPNLARGDSLVWTGVLRDNVAVRYSLRAVSFDEESLHVVGTGELWITE